MKVVSWKGRALGMGRWAVASGLAAGALFAATLLPAAAAPLAADPTPTATATPVDGREVAPVREQSQRLETLLQREQEQLARLERNLARANERAARIQERVNRLKGEGRDGTPWETALSGFKSSIAYAQTSFDRARSTLDARAGFDADGHVTDPAQAKTTLKTAGRALREAARTLRHAYLDLARAVRDLRSSNRP